MLSIQILVTEAIAMTSKWWSEGQLDTYRVEVIQANCRRETISPKLWFDYSKVRITDAFGHTKHKAGDEIEVKNTELSDYFPSEY